MLGIMLRHQRRRLEEDCLTAVLLIKRAEVSPLGRGPPLSSCLTTRNSGPTLAVFIFKWLSSWAGFSQQTQGEGEKNIRLAWIELFLVRIERILVDREGASSSRDKKIRSNFL